MLACPDKFDVAYSCRMNAHHGCNTARLERIGCFVYSDEMHDTSGLLSNPFLSLFVCRTAPTILSHLYTRHSCCCLVDAYNCKPWHVHRNIRGNRCLAHRLESINLAGGSICCVNMGSGSFVSGSSLSLEGQGAVCPRAAAVMHLTHGTATCAALLHLAIGSLPYFFRDATHMLLGIQW